MTQKKEYHRFDRIATKMYGATRSNCRTTIHIGQLRKNKIQKWTHRLK
jgi:hypothetical protein